MSPSFDAFISYGRADSKVFATELYSQLTEQGFKVWFDQNDIPLAVNFQTKLMMVLKKLIIFYLSLHRILLTHRIASKKLT
ncbi:MAG: TIR domain-containing protein [Thioploca sp.]|nr:TIR domain-containing protein [Thioploca sp.]